LYRIFPEHFYHKHLSYASSFPVIWLVVSFTSIATHKANGMIKIKQQRFKNTGEV